ncbi:MAG: hypothetical protein J6T25_03505 [Bacilli bacterium]|nr:hypothetical protein [Bacilli bacterium]
MSISTNKDHFKRLIEVYSPLIKLLIESNQIYTDIDEPIKWCFAWDDNVSITATVNRITNVLSINLAFVDAAFKCNKVYEIEYFILHEIRHIYQHIQIVLYKDGKSEIGEEYIKRWIVEGENYIKSLDKDGNENIKYFKQDCELDAYAFSYAVMHHKYSGKYDSLLYLPELYGEELKSVFDLAVRDFLEGIQ